MALAALVLTALTLGPGLDGLLCRDEGGLSAVAAASPTAEAADSGHSGGADEGADICVHGHCHHSAPYVPAALAAVETPGHLTDDAHLLARARIPTSDPKFSVMRPPRA
jgi:hypothetical protein